jgi:hypothetical protein
MLLRIITPLRPHDLHGTKLGTNPITSLLVTRETNAGLYFPPIDSIAILVLIYSDVAILSLSAATPNDTILPCDFNLRKLNLLASIHKARMFMVQAHGFVRPRSRQAVGPPEFFI